MYMQTQVGIRYRYVRTVAGLLAELVNDGVLYLVANKFRVAKLFREHHGINGKGLVVAEIGRPVYLLDFIIHVIGTAGLEVLDRFKNLDGGV